MNSSDVLDFWFGTPDSAGHGQPRALWFEKSVDTDRLIAERFGSAVEEALQGGFAEWAGTPRGALALILLLDQFTRNMFRGTPRAFAGDVRALALAAGMVDSGWDQQLAPVERWFAYMPFEHSECLIDQFEAVRLFERLAAHGLDAPLPWARRHYEVIVRFGRFPHRNAVLGRASTPEERAFLEQPGSSF